MHCLSSKSKQQNRVSNKQTSKVAHAAGDDVAELLLGAECVEAGLVDDLTEELDERVVVRILHAALVVDLDADRLVDRVVLEIDEVGAVGQHHLAKVVQLDLLERTQLLGRAWLLVRSCRLATASRQLQLVLHNLEQIFGSLRIPLIA